MRLMSPLSSCHSLFIILSFHHVSGLVFDKGGSCKAFSTFGNVEDKLERAYKQQKPVVSAAWTRLNTFVNHGDILETDEYNQIARLLTAFAIGPFAPVAPGAEIVLPRKTDNKGYPETMKSLLDNLKTIQDADESQVPTMWCDAIIIAWEKVVDEDISARYGKFVNVTKYPDNYKDPKLAGKDVIDPDTKLASFYLWDYLTPTDPVEWPVGMQPCGGSHWASITPNRKNIIWCPKGWAEMDAKTFPTSDDDRTKDYSQDPSKGIINYWIQTLPMLFTQELHRAFIKPTTNYEFKPEMPNGIKVAVNFAGVSALPQLVVKNSNWALLGSNAGTTTLIAIALYMVGTDWAFEAGDMAIIVDRRRAFQRSYLGDTIEQ